MMGNCHVRFLGEGGGGDATEGKEHRQAATGNREGHDWNSRGAQWAPRVKRAGSGVTSTGWPVSFRQVHSVPPDASIHR